MRKWYVVYLLDRETGNYTQMDMHRTRRDAEEAQQYYEQRTQTTRLIVSETDAPPFILSPLAALLYAHTGIGETR